MFSLIGSDIQIGESAAHAVKDILKVCLVPAPVGATKPTAVEKSARYTFASNICQKCGNF